MCECVRESGSADASLWSTDIAADQSVGALGAKTPYLLNLRATSLALICVGAMAGRSAILIAEDDANDAFFLERALAQAGMNGSARFVKTGREAIDYLQGNPPFDHRGKNPLPNLLVLDLKMPS